MLLPGPIKKVGWATETSGTKSGTQFRVTQLSTAQSPWSELALTHIHTILLA